MDVAIEAEGLRKRYRGHEALRGIDLSVPAGTVLGVLGPNGAGKTTAVRVLTTLLAADGGRARVAGFDVAAQPGEVRRRIGLTGQYAAVDELLTGRENLTLIGRLHRLGRKGAKAKAAELLDQFDLTEAGDRPSHTYSGGMRRRLDLAASLLSEPQVIFLDEPTTGLDPASRIALWGMVRDQVARGVTVLLTTQYLEEADQLADRIAVIEAGRVIAEGAPAELKRTVGGERLEVSTANVAHLGLAAEALAKVAPDDRIVVEETEGRITIPLTGGVRGITAAAAALEAAGVEVQDFSVRRPSLDDVFLSLTGRSDRSEPAKDPATDPATTEPTQERAAA
ncbi:ATP-binding cassette domain-containing protein [Streptomyces sp. rh34]|uniref:ATP-binding cassette domain-containing protein n=1 Tax=Streptomyces sp. rh34 TaxID=2034272 RepID=UPI000BF15DD8|nr:ATP-binding cassette domain-containing protein [Streptomyces sp. rh34]